MRDVSFKFTSLRTAVARAILNLSPETVELIKTRRIPKGDPLDIARVTAMQAAKDTSRIIPYCHPLPIEFVGVEYEIGERTIQVDVTVKAVARTGVEMEALTAASVAVLTFYDMMKMLDDDMSIGAVTLLSKTGGKSDFRRRASDTPGRAAVLVLSDSVSTGKAEDSSGALIAERLAAEKYEVVARDIISDDLDGIIAGLRRYADEQQLDLVITTGGTGFGLRDNTPEAMNEIIEKEAPGIIEAVRTFAQDRVPFSMLSRGRAGIRGRTLIVNLPGSRNAVADALDALFPALRHIGEMIEGRGH